MKAFLVSRFSFLVALAAALASAQPPPTMVPPVRGIHEMVGAANNFEVEAGYRILTQGGNAVDAGVATVLAASVTELSRFGLGGEMPAPGQNGGKTGGGDQRHRSGAGQGDRRILSAPLARAVGGRGPHAAGADAGDSFGYYARRVRRPDSGARKIRHQILRRSGGAGHRICRAGLSDAGRVRRICCAATSAS